MIYTTYFSNLRHLPDTIVPISIAGKTPEGFIGPKYKNLAPHYDFFQEWKHTGDNDRYIECYYARVLDHLNPKEVEDFLYFLSDGMDLALVCYEKPENFCHRHLVADWLRSAGIEVEEWKT